MFASVFREERLRNRSFQLSLDGAQTELLLCLLTLEYLQRHGDKAELPR